MATPLKPLVVQAHSGFNGVTNLLNTWYQAWENIIKYSKCIKSKDRPQSNDHWTNAVMAKQKWMSAGERHMVEDRPICKHTGIVDRPFLWTKKWILNNWAYQHASKVASLRLFTWKKQLYSKFLRDMANHAKQHASALHKTLLHITRRQEKTN